MTKIQLSIGVLILGLVFSKSSFAYSTKKTNENGTASVSRTIKSEAGLNIPQWGIAIDASFDHRLTDLVPGYHVLNLVLTNRRQGVLRLDPVNDRWIVVTADGRRIVAKNNADKIAPEAWASFSDSLKHKLSYPHSVKAGNYVTIDVFIPKKFDLNNFKEITWKSATFSKEFNIFTNIEEQLGAQDSNQQPIPNENAVNLDHLSIDQLREKLKSPKITKWERQELEREEKTKLDFDPSFDDAIIIK